MGQTQSTRGPRNLPRLGGAFRPKAVIDGGDHDPAATRPFGDHVHQRDRIAPSRDRDSHGGQVARQPVQRGVNAKGRIGGGQGHGRAIDIRPDRPRDRRHRRPAQPGLGLGRKGGSWKAGRDLGQIQAGRSCVPVALDHPGDAQQAFGGARAIGIGCKAFQPSGRGALGVACAVQGRASQEKRLGGQGAAGMGLGDRAEHIGGPAEIAAGHDLAGGIEIGLFAHGCGFAALGGRLRRGRPTRHAPGLRGGQGGQVAGFVHLAQAEFEVGDAALAIGRDAVDAVSQLLGPVCQPRQALFHRVHAVDGGIPACRLKALCPRCDQFGPQRLQLAANLGQFGPQIGQRRLLGKGRPGHRHGQGGCGDGADDHDPAPVALTTVTARRLLA